jgi:hypothetical protein
MRTDITSDTARPGGTPPEAEPGAAVQENLHPVVYTAIIALALWLIVSAWVFFGGADYDGITLVVVTGLFVVAIGIPVLLWRIWQRNADHSGDAPVPSFRDWRSGELATWTGRHAATAAVIETLLPIAAVAFGMTAIGLVFLLA